MFYIPLFIFLVLNAIQGTEQQIFRPQCRAGVCDDRPECPRSACRCVYPSRLDCALYYQCVNGKPYQYRCSPGLLFNSDTLTCDYSFKVNCTINASTAQPVNTTTEIQTSTEITTATPSTMKELTTTAKSTPFRVPTTAQKTLITKEETTISTAVTQQADTTKIFTTTSEAITISTEADTATEIPTTTADTTILSTATHTSTEDDTTIELHTTTEEIMTTVSSTEADTTTEILTSTEKVTTAKITEADTTKAPTTTEKITTSVRPSSTEVDTTTEMHTTKVETTITSTVKPTTTEVSTTPRILTSAEKLKTESIANPTTAELSTSEIITTTENTPVTTRESTTTNLPRLDFSCPSRVGLFPDPKSCFRFYHCSHWVPYHKWCPSGLHFNPVLKVCDWPYRAGCEFDNLTTSGTTTTSQIFPTATNTTQCDCDCCELPVPDDCSTYITCIDRVAFKMTCGSGLYFNPMTSTCDLKENVVCELDIQCPEPNGRFPYPNSCTHFLDCRDGKMNISKCPDGLNFDQVLETCSWTGSCSGHPNPIPTSEPTDSDICDGCDYCFKPNSHDCTQYVRCSNGFAFQERCASGLFYNPVAEVCDHDYNVVCSEPIPLPQCPSANGYFPYPGECRRYLHCVNGSQTVKKCSGILHFDPKKKHCDWPWAAGCREPDSNATLEPFQNSTECDCDCCLEPVSGDCRSFTICINQVGVRRSCSSGLLYNPMTENCDFAESVDCEDMPEPSGLRCPQHAGLFPDPDDCNKFIQCSHGIPYVKDCPANLHFNPQLKVCDWPYSAGCQAFPTIQPPEDNPGLPCDVCNSCFLPNENDCSAYTYCLNGTGYKLQCSSNLLFNPEIEACDIARNVNCPTYPDSQCPEPDGLFPASACTKFIHCSNGIPYMKNCPDGLHFNAQTLVCDWPKIANCGGQPIDPTKPDNENDLTNVTCSCDCCFLPDKNNCSKYLLCLDGLVHRGQCSSGLLFNPEIQNCDFAERVNCSAESPFCLTPNGLFPNPDNCSTFYRCTSGVPHLEDCPSGLHFNSNSKQCLHPCNAKCNVTEDCLTTPGPTTILISTTTDKPSICAGAADGFHPVKDDCTSFYLCSAEEAYTVKCPDGFHYSAEYEICEDPCEAKCDPNITCETTSSSPELRSTSKPTTSTTSPLCPEPNGMYSVEGNCSSFYKCSNGQPHVVNCAKGLHFSHSHQRCERPCEAKCDPTINCTSPSPPNITTSTTSTPVVTTLSPFCPQSEGLYPIEDNCRSFYHCTNGHAHQMKCPTGLHFSAEHHICEHPCTADCDKTIDCTSLTPQETTSGPTEAAITLSPHCAEAYGLYPVDGDCSSFYLCSNGKEHLIRCPPDLHYSTEHETCEQPCDARCNASIECIITTQASTPEPTLPPVQTLSPLCPEANGLFPNPDDCESFYQCSNGKAHFVRCPSGLHFSPGDEVCERPCVAGCDINIACPTEIPDVIGNCTCNNCFLPDPTDCSAYYFCSNLHQTKGYCPYGMLFDKIAHTCKSEDVVNCEATGDPAMCPEPYGVFSYPGDCTKFIHCEDSVAHVNQCENDLEFDPENRICSKPKGFCGLTTTDIHCLHPTGLFPHSDNCSLFYQCERGVAYLKVCKTPLLFNARDEVCDWPENAACGRNESSSTTTSELPTTKISWSNITSGYTSSYSSSTNESTTQSNITSGYTSAYPSPTNESTTQTSIPINKPTDPPCHEVPGVICPCACRVPTYDECSSFYQCQEDGTACKKFCPEGLFFNKKEMVCDLPSNVECRDFFFTTMKMLRSSSQLMKNFTAKKISRKNRT